METLRSYLTGYVWLITAFDIYCCQYLTPDVEMNPLARIIMVNFGVWVMVACKVFGTFLVTELLRRLHIAYTLFVTALMTLLFLILVEIVPI